MTSVYGVQWESAVWVVNATCILEFGAYELCDKEDLVFSLVPANYIAIKPNGVGL